MTTESRKAKADRATIRRDDGAIIIDIPMNLRRRSGRKEIVLPPGVAPVAESAGTDDSPSPLSLSLARAFRWQEMIESGQVQSNSDLARKLKLDQSYIARTIRLTSLAPDLVEAILDGQEPEALSLNTLRQSLPVVWSEQQLDAVSEYSDQVPCDAPDARRATRRLPACS